MDRLVRGLARDGMTGDRLQEVGSVKLGSEARVLDVTVAVRGTSSTRVPSACNRAVRPTRSQ
jgi:hypothetical protein